VTAFQVSEEARARYPLAFSPFTLKGVELRNRIIRTSMGSGLPSGGLVSPDLFEFHLARARGGVALTFVDPAMVHWSSPGYLHNLRDDFAASMRPLTDAVHAEGTKVFQQLMHGGPTNNPQDGTSPWGASPVPDPGLGVLTRPMTRWMMDEVTEGFVLAARHARDGGIDGVEVHGGHGYIFSSFLSPATNHRTDEYGGSFENRARYLLEVLAALRDGLGDFPLGVRLSSDYASHQTSGDDLKQLSKILEERELVDWINLSYGSHWGRDKLMGAAHEPPGYQLAEVNDDVAAGISLPTIATGRFGQVAQIEETLAMGHVDLVAMVRATIADPDLVRKTAEGREALIRPCIACNQACVGGLNTKARIFCTVNVAAGREIANGDDSLHAAAAKRILIVGGGPAGIEAARAGIVAGHTVTLVESSDSLGGQMRYAANSPHRRQALQRLLDYWPVMLADLGLDLRLGVTATAEMVRDFAPDAVILATGSTPRRDGFQVLHPWAPPAGFDPDRVLTSWDVMSGARTSGTVAVLDEVGHYETSDVAQLLVEQGHRVRLISRFSLVAANLEMRWDMVGSPNAKFLYEGDFKFFPRRVITSVADGKVTFEKPEAPGDAETVDFDYLVTIGGNVPNYDLYEELRTGPWMVRTAGDASGPRLLEAATFEGNQAIRSLEPDWVRPNIRFGVGGSAM
jgi:2,4-dienoyl-CoA reductase-like NADH-dependent reductase (Old Yellow Enzyme family)